MVTLLFLFLLLILLYHQANSQDLSHEKAILLSLKQHWGNPPSLKSWNSSSFHCDWPGVGCTSGVVTALNLAEKEINGTIPSSIGQLTGLITIDLSRNYISGTIPGEFLVMKRLCSLLLYGNRLSGEMPTPIQAPLLENLDLSNNHFNGSIPDDIKNLKSLTRLDMSMNSFIGMIPKGLGELTRLHHLDLSDNQLSGNVVENIFYLRLESIWLCSNNFFGKIPFELVDQYYENKCLDPSNLCSDYNAEGLASCPSSLCSDHRIKAFLKCDDISKRYFVITIVETAGCGVVGFAILYYLARKCWLKKRDAIAAGCKKLWLSGSSRVFINQLSTAVAVKSISNARKSDHGLEKEFLAEVQTLGTIRHNNIVKLFCCISGKELKLLVYQYFENKSLDRWQEQHGLLACCCCCCLWLDCRIPESDVQWLLRQNQRAPQCQQ